MGATCIRFGINNLAIVEDGDHGSTAANLGYLLRDYGVRETQSLLCGDAYVEASGYPYNHVSLGCRAIWESLDIDASAGSSRCREDDTLGAMDFVGYYRIWDGGDVPRRYGEPDFFITVMADGSVFTGDSDPLAGKYNDLVY